MVNRETDFPLISYEIAAADFPEETFRLVILVSLKQRWLRSQDYFVTPTEGERDSIRALVQSKVDLMESKERESVLRSATHYEPPPHFPIPNDPENAKEWREYEQRQKEAGARYLELIVEQQAQTSTLEKQVQQSTANIRSLPCIATILQSARRWKNSKKFTPNLLLCSESRSKPSNGTLLSAYRTLSGMNTTQGTTASADCTRN